MTIRISFSDKTVRVAVEINGAIESAITELPQRPWVDLTEEKIKEIWLNGKDHGDDWADVLSLARAFEYEIKRENT